MKIEDDILDCIKERPGIGAQKIVACIHSKSIHSTVINESNTHISIFKRLRSLKRNGIVHNRGDRWYVITPAK